MAQLFTGELSSRDDVGDNLDFHGLTELQAVKFMLGCYGTGDSNIGKDAWNNFDNTAKTLLLNNLQNTYAPAYTDSVCSCIDDMMLAELKTEQFCYVPSDVDGASLFSKYTGSDGTAMTQAIFDEYKEDYTCVTETFADVDKVGAEITKNEFETHTALYRSADQYAPPAPHIAWMNGKLFTANAYGVTEKTEFTVEKRKRYHEDLTRMCVESAPPIHAMSYEDTVPAPLYLFIGQLLLILAASQVHESFVKFDVGMEFAQERHNEISQAKQRNGARSNFAGKPGEDSDISQRLEEETQSMHYMQAFKILFVLAITVVLVWLSIDDYNLWGSSDATMPTFRLASKQHDRVPVLALFVWVATGITLLVTVLYELYMSRAHSSLKTQDVMPEGQPLNKNGAVSLAVATWGFHKNGNIAMMLKHIACDVPLIAGFAIMSVGVFAQSDITSVQSLVGCSLIIVVLGFLQHISNLVKGLYTRICARLDAKMVMRLTLYDESSSGPRDMRRTMNPDATNVLNTVNGSNDTDDKMVETHVRPILQFFGYTRLYIFLVIVVGVIVLTFIAKDTSSVYTLHSMLDGQFLYFLLAFLVCTVGFDLLYEVLPFMFEDKNTESTRVQVLLAYVIFFCVNQLLYFWRLPQT